MIGDLAKPVSSGEPGAPSSLEEKPGGSLGEWGLQRWDFPAFTWLGKHILISAQCLVFTQHQCLLVKTSNNAWTMKLWCDERQGRPQGRSASHVPTLHPVETLLLRCTCSYS